MHKAMASRGPSGATRFQIGYLHIATHGRRLAPQNGQLNHNHLCLQPITRVRRLAPRRGQLAVISPYDHPTAVGRWPCRTPSPGRRPPVQPSPWRPASRWRPLGPSRQALDPSPGSRPAGPPCRNGRSAAAKHGKLSGGASPGRPERCMLAVCQHSGDQDETSGRNIRSAAVWPSATPW